MDTPAGHPEPLNTDIGAAHFSGVLTMGGGVVHGGGVIHGGGVVHVGGPLWISEDATTS